MAYWKPLWASRFFGRDLGHVGGERSNVASIGFYRSVFPAVPFALAFAFCVSESSLAQKPDDGVYASAVAYCRGDVTRPMALDPDKRILCFDGAISPGQEFSLVKHLREDGLFVVRGFGNDSAIAITLSDLLRERHATVVIYDYCLSACASYLLVASDRTVVLRDTLVAWRHFGAGPKDCAGFASGKDQGPLRLEVGSCPNPPLQFQNEPSEIERRKEQFYKDRFTDPTLEFPPQSFSVRRTLKNLVDETGLYPDVMWTWNPRYGANAVKAEIIYQAYPESQSEIDALAARLHLRYKIIYDP